MNIITNRKFILAKHAAVSPSIDFPLDADKLPKKRKDDPQDGNGRVGRLILLKECLKYGITPFVIAENFKQFYYLGLSDWRRGSRLRLLDTCRTGQDVFILGLRQFGHVRLAEKATADMAQEAKAWKERNEH